ncbi:hypothetical protein F5144DRAFT_559260 [Chaetomium tenue]|uniref:Uncharacterized protein n=1 Tax=Chaetomium tenue TaxID=1854479 RepID=A0ACB7PR31_9PEZI|nr:hypothetical protein F5144DRAFT_559260 [Chaetomium globosum]
MMQKDVRRWILFLICLLSYIGRPVAGKSWNAGLERHAKGERAMKIGGLGGQCVCMSKSGCGGGCLDEFRFSLTIPPPCISSSSH